MTKNLVIKCPLPKDFFETTGIGESDHQIHAGSYHLAMQQARIERANLIAYTSILPSTARRITVQEGVKQIQHGSEMKIIQAAAHVDKKTGEKRATAAIMYGLLYKKGSAEQSSAGLFSSGKKGSKKHEGGLVCEYNGNGTLAEARENLTNCLDGLYKNPNPDGKSFADEYELRDIRFLSSTVEPKKRFGTALCALAFVNYIIPVISHEMKPLVRSFASARGI
jgi:arginine decarboxylase